MTSDDARNLVNAAYKAMESYDKAIRGYGDAIDEQLIARVEEHGDDQILDVTNGMPPIEQYIRESMLDEQRSEMQRKCVAAIAALVKVGYLDE